jgi:hypothetical protein
MEKRNSEPPNVSLKKHKRNTFSFFLHAFWPLTVLRYKKVVIKFTFRYVLTKVARKNNEKFIKELVWMLWLILTSFSNTGNN